MNYTIEHSVPSRESWLALRRQDVTASVAGALLGVHEYCTPFQLYALKAGEISDDVELSPAMERGRLLEPVAYKLYQREKPGIMLEWNGTPGGLPGKYFTDPRYRLGATPDALAWDERGPGVVQFKSVEAGIFRKKWFERDPDADAPEIHVPLWIAVQTIIEADLVGAKWGQVAALVVGYGIDLHIIDIPLHTGALDRVREMSINFWDCVNNKQPPPPDFGRDGEALSEMYGKSNGRTIDLSGDNRIPGLLEEREKLSGERKVAKKRIDEIRAELIAKIGPNEIGIAHGWQVTHSRIHSDAFVMPARDYSRLYAKRPKP